MSDQYYWKKQSEQEDLDRFIAAYAGATGETLALVKAGETPDFICERQNGDQVGVELTKIIAHSESRFWHRLFGHGAMACYGDIESRISEIAAEKTMKLRKVGWQPSQTVLVIQLFDNPLSEKQRELEQIDGDDFAEFGFAEIWVSDHSTLEAYDLVELFGIYPKRIAGYYELTAGRKPYG